MTREKEIVSHEFTTMVNILRWRAIHQSEQSALTFLVDGETQEETLTYQRLDAGVVLLP
jgi:hypothetical protein